MKKHSLSPLTVIAVSATMLTVGAAAWRLTAESDALRVSAKNTPRTIVAWRHYAPKNNDSRQVSLVIFSDYYCRHCRSALFQLRVLRTQFPNELNIRWRSYPVLGSESVSAAVAAVCARRAGKFDLMHERLFAEGGELGQRPWTQLALEVGVGDTARFSGCLRDDSALEEVRRDLADARELSILGTPAVLLDSLLFTGAPPLRYLRAYIARSTGVKH